MLKILKLILSVFIGILVQSTAINAADSDYWQTQVAAISGFAQPAGSSENIPGVEVIVLETGQTVAYTDSSGNYSFEYPVGQSMTLMFRKNGYKTSQTGTFTVPPEGFSGLHNNITYQAIGHKLYELMKYAVEITSLELIKSDACQLITTVTAYGKTLYDDPQGEPGATLSVQDQSGKTHHGKTCYFGIFRGKTLPVCFNQKTSEDGGVFVLNLEAKPNRDIPNDIHPENNPYQVIASKPGLEYSENNSYQVIASKPGLKFSTHNANCNPEWWARHAPGEDMLINMSPPQGPTVLH